MPPRSESAYTGPADDGGLPCSDQHHAAMILPDGAPYEVAEYRCGQCGEPDGFHHRKASCGTISATERGQPLEVQWHGTRDHRERRADETV